MSTRRYRNRRRASRKPALKRVFRRLVPVVRPSRFAPKLLARAVYNPYILRRSVKVVSYKTKRQRRIAIANKILHEVRYREVTRKNCKSRPDSRLAPKGKGGSRPFIPWCTRRR